MIRKSFKSQTKRPVRGFSKHNELRASLRRKQMKKESFTNEWDSLMNECFDIDTHCDAMDYFVDVEKTTEKLNLLCEDGKPFNASVAIKEWDRLEKRVERMCDDLQDKYGEDFDDLPCVGLNYFRMADTLVIGIYDRGNFDSYAGWEFHEAMSDKRQLETRRPIRLNVLRRNRF